jgi:hypothetical protein
MPEKGAIGNRLRRAIGRAGLFSAIGVASVVPRIRMPAWRFATRGGKRRSPTLPCARSEGPIDVARPTADQGAEPLQANSGSTAARCQRRSM